MKHAKLGLVVAVALALPVAMQAQNTKQPVKRRQQPIEIRGQVPTYSRQVLYPRLYDHDFWPSILPAYQLVTKRQMTGMVPVDSATVRSDSAAAGRLRGTTPAGTTPVTPGDSVRQQAPVARPDSVTPPPGPPPARTSR